LFPLFATGVIDTGGKFATGINGKMVAKFATGVVDNGGAPWLANLRKFSKKFKTVKCDTLGLGGN
jgi:hypothetical protein